MGHSWSDFSFSYLIPPNFKDNIVSTEQLIVKTESTNSRFIQSTEKRLTERVDPVFFFFVNWIKFNCPGQITLTDIPY